MAKNRYSGTLSGVVNWYDRIMRTISKLNIIHFIVQLIVWIFKLIFNIIRVIIDFFVTVILIRVIGFSRYVSIKMITSSKSVRISVKMIL
jgi:hypothetical protein